MKMIMIAAMSAIFGLSMMTNVKADEKATVRVCTGGETGVYYDAGQTIQKWAGTKLNIEIIETEGSIDNIERVLSGDCEAFIAQPDSLVHVAKTNPAVKKRLKPVGVLHREYLQVLCNKDSNVDDLNDLEGSSKTLDIGAPGSGAWTTWQNLVAEDSGYESIKTSSDGGDIALASVSNGDTDCMLVASGLKSGIMQQADTNYSDTVTLVGANDKDFNDAVGIDGKPLYVYNEIDSVYPNLQNSWGSDVDTISWTAGVYVDTSAIDKKVQAQFIRIVADAAGEIKGKYGK